MRIYLVKRSYFTFQGKKSYELDLLGENALELMRKNLGAEVVEGELPAGEKAVLYPVYPFLTEEKFKGFLKEHKGSFSFDGGYVVRGGSEGVLLGRIEEGLFSLADYSALLARAGRENALRLLKRGVLVGEGAEVSSLAEIGSGTVVGRGARIVGGCVIGKNVRIGLNCEIVESVVGDGSEIAHSVLNHARVGKNTKIGPFAYLRPNSVVGDNCRIGDFVELKGCTIGSGSKAAHLSYIGDAEIGQDVNIGCGVVFANYNGKTKRGSKVGDKSFIGSNCNLIAPVTVGDGSFIAAGTTLTKDLNAQDFCIGRCRETVKEGGAKKYLE